MRQQTQRTQSLVLVALLALGCGEEDKPDDTGDTPAAGDAGKPGSATGSRRDAAVDQPDTATSKPVDAGFKDPTARAVPEKIVRDVSGKDSVAVCQSYVGHYELSLGRLVEVGCVFQTRRDGNCGTSAIDTCIDKKIDDLDDIDCSDGLSEGDRDCDVTAGELYDCLDAWAANHKEWAAKFTCSAPLDDLEPIFEAGPAKPESCLDTETKCPGLLEGLFDYE